MHSLKRVAIGFAAALLVTLGVAPLGASPASAHSGWTWCESSNDAGEVGAHGCWLDDGDDWAACDEDTSDSYYAWVEFRTQNANGTWSLRGTSDDGDDAGCDNGVDVDVLNGQHFRIRVCVRSSPTASPVSCDVRESWE